MSAAPPGPTPPPPARSILVLSERRPQIGPEVALLVGPRSLTRSEQHQAQPLAEPPLQLRTRAFPLLLHALVHLEARPAERLQVALVGPGRRLHPAQVQ